MPLDFIRIDERAKNVAMWDNTTGKRLYLNSDQSTVVMEDDPDASYVLVGPGGRIPMEDAVRYGLVAKDDVPPVEQPDMPEATAQPNDEVADALTAVPEDEGVEDREDKEVTLGEGSKAQEPASNKAQAPASDKAAKK